MTQASEIRKAGYASQEAPTQSKLAMGLMMARVLRRNPAILKNVFVVGPDEPRFVRPPRAYELPEYREGMKRCTSNEKYLRPTRWCNPREPLVIAIANELGAYERSDWEFAEAAYWFSKTTIVPEALPLDGVSATLKRGTGGCMQVVSLWIALCRTAGIKARYMTFKTQMDETLLGLGLDPSQMVALEGIAIEETEQATLPNIINIIPTGHAAAEACIDGKWISAEVATRPEMAAIAGAPILKFGEDLTGSAWRLIPGTIERFESLPLIAAIALTAMLWFAPASMERGSIAMAGTIPRGRKIIEEAGGIEAYDSNARRRRMLFSEEEITRKIKEASVRKSWSLKGDERDDSV
jgi:hypothetical protein